MGYAFISYSSKNKDSADAIRNLFQKHQIDTWMAPNNIPVGSKYAQVINHALKECACLVLLLTQNAQDSLWVAKEVERAINYKKVIIPIQLEDLVLNDEFEFYICTDQVVFVSKIDESTTEIKNILKRVAACVNQDDHLPVSTVQAVENNAAQPAEQGTVDQWECYNLGYSYEFGVGRPINYEEAVKWYLKSANQGNAWSQNRLGDCYMNGNGVPKNPETAVKWYTLGANNQDKTAQYNLASCYMNGTGVAKNCAMAFDYYCKAANQGHEWAQYAVGFCYEFGQGVGVDYIQACRWYQKAAEQGNSWSQHRLGESYYYGKGVPQDYQKAFYWLKLAADSNNKGVYSLVAECYRNGLGVERNLQLAEYWSAKMME